MQDVYGYEPVQEDWAPEYESLLMGVQASMWTEFCDTPEDVEYLLFPRLAALAEVGALLQKSLREAFGVTVSREALADTFWHTRALRRMFISRFRIKYALFWLVEPAFGGRGAVTGHITPARLAGTGKHPKGSLPCPWIHPFTGEEHADELNALL